MIKKIIDFIIRLFFKKDETPKEKQKRNYYYQKKELLTPSEIKFYNTLKEAIPDKYIIQSQVALSSVISKEGNFKYQNELYKTIDFGIFKKDSLEIILLIELNDYTHKKSSRKKRDFKVKSICKEANIKLLTFWVEYPNELDYVKERITKSIDDESI